MTLSILWLFLTVPWVGLQCVFVVFPDHTHLGNTPFFITEQPKTYLLWSCQKVCDALLYLLDNLFIRFGSELFRQVVCISMGTYCDPLVTDFIFVLLLERLHVVSF